MNLEDNVYDQFVNRALARLNVLSQGNGWDNYDIDTYSCSDTIQTVQEHETFGPWWYPLSGPYNDQWKWLNQTIIHFGRSLVYELFTSHISTYNEYTQIFWLNDLYGFEFIEYWRIPAVDSAFKHGDNNNMTNYDIHEYFPFNVLWYQLGPGGVNETGNYWVRGESFPPPTDTMWYLNSDGKLSTSTQSTADSSSFVYNPKV